LPRSLCLTTATGETWPKEDENYLIDLYTSNLSNPSVYNKYNDLRRAFADASGGLCSVMT